MPSLTVEERESNGNEKATHMDNSYIENDEGAIRINASQSIDTDCELDPFPVDQPHLGHYYYYCCWCSWIQQCVKHPSCDHLRKHWKILALGQLVSLTLASAGAAQATLKLDCNLNAPTFTVSIYYFFLSWHVFILIGRHRADGAVTNAKTNHIPVDTEDAADALATTTTTEEEEHDVSLPAHSFFFGLFPMHKPLWLYFIIALVDVEANAVTTLSFRYTTLTSVTLFDNLAIPTAMAISRCFFSRRYTWIHFSGVAICMVGVLLNMIQDYDDDKDVEEQEEYPHKLRGDILAITGGVLYGINNVMVEVTIRDTGDTMEYLGSMGFFALLIATVQALALEWKDILEFLGRGGNADGEACTSERWWLLFAYVGCTVFSYMGASRFFQISEATFFGLSLLSGDLWSVIFSVFAEGIVPHSLFFIALVFVLGGMIIYEMAPSPVVGDRSQNEGNGFDMDSTNAYNDIATDFQQEQAGSNFDNLEMKQISISPSNSTLV